MTKHQFAIPLCRALMSALFALTITALSPGISAQDVHHGFDRDNLIVSRSVYDNRASNVTVGQVLPPNCLPASGGCVQAVANGVFPFIFNNAPVDASFGITSRIFLDEIDPSGHVIRSLEVPNSLDWWIGPTSDQLVTSFSSKSEMGLHLSTDGRYLTFMGYVAPVNAVDVSNSNTPLAPDSTNPVPSSYYRAVARMDRWGHFDFTETNAYSGNNGRSAILNNTWGNDVYFTAGNAGNGSTPQPQNVVLGAGAQILSPVDLPESDQTPGLPTPVASFSVTELGDKADKVGKDDNFRGMTIFNNVLYFTKGSGGNGVNTVYYVNTSDTPCANGVGIPAANAKLPTTPINFTLPLPSTGLPNNMCVLAGFPTLSNKNGNPVNFPFSLWFADANTLYVADEGDGTPTYDTSTNTYTDAAAQSNAGLEKWIFNASAQSWDLAYTLQSGLDLGTPYTVLGYPTGINTATNLPWAPTTDGLRNIAGRVNDDGTVTIWAITSTTSGGGDTGADPDKLVVITDKLRNGTAADAANERFHTIRTARFGEVLRGISFAPEGDDRNDRGDDR